MFSSVYISPKLPNRGEIYEGYEKNKICTARFTVCISFQFAHPTHATIERDGATWWSIEELLEVYEEEVTERRTKCGEPPSNCYTDMYFDMINQEPKYRALDRVTPVQLRITSINPAKETIKIVFFDKTISGFINGAKEYMTLERLYIGWVDGKEKTQLDAKFETLLYGSIPGHHIVYYGDEETEGKGWAPARKEIELNVSGSNLIDNTSGILDFKAAGIQYVASGKIDYSNCLKSPDYREGMECKLYSSDKKTVTYFPYVEPVSTKSSKESTDEPAEQPSGQPIDSDHDLVDGRSIDDDPELTGEQLTDSGYGQADGQQTGDDYGQTDEQSTSGVVVPKAPETGKSQIASNHDPGLIIWFISLMVIAVLLTIWWFIPTQAEKSRKKYKKSKKSIDKTRDLR